MFILSNTDQLFTFFLMLFQGREEGAEIDPWEDGDFIVYKVTDRYGFLQ